MKKQDLIRYKAALAALMLSSGMFLGGCKKGFDLTIDEERDLVAEEDSYIHNDFIKKCCVVEARSNITNESNIYLVKKEFSMNLPSNVKYCEDIFTNIILFTDNNDCNTSFEVINEVPLMDYLISLELVKGSYSYEDMKNIYEQIKAIYEFENKELVK